MATQAVEHIKKMIADEIEFHKNNNNKNLNDDYKYGFIKGLEQVSILIDNCQAIKHGLIK